MSENFKEAIQSAQPVLVDFYATWCGPCQRMHPILEEVKNRVGDKARILKIDVDQNQQVAAEYKVSTIPTLILFKNGMPIWREIGVQSASSLVSKIESAISE